MKKKRILTRTEIESLRIEALKRVERKELLLKDAAQLFQLSYSQAKRLFSRLKTQGEAGLAHHLRGKPSNNAFDAETKQAILNLYKERYADFGPTLACEKLLSAGLCVDHETLRRWLIEEGLWEKHRKRSLHRSWRERRPHFGELVQMDGSHHPWFELRGEESCLMNMVDDATGVTLSLMSEEETTEAAMTLLWKWIETFGIPAALYTDHKNVYVVDEKSALRASLEGEERLTQFGRACKKLGIIIIKAHSPQAKGRVERSNQTYQDRLVKEMRLAGISDIASANELLYSGFLEELNSKFAVEATEEEDYHRKAVGVDLASIFCREEERSISRDWMVRFENGFYQLKRQSKYEPASRQVMVRKYLNGELHFNYRGEDIPYQKLAERPVRISKSLSPKKTKRNYKPSPNHPWRKSWKQETK
jgi:transposase